MKSYENEARRNMWQCNPNIKDWIIWIILPHQDEPSAASGRTGATRGEVEARPRLIPPVHVAVACLRTSAVGQLDWRRTRLSYNGGSGTSCRWLSLALKHCHAPSVQAAPWIFDIWCMVKKKYWKMLQPYFGGWYPLTRIIGSNFVVFCQEWEKG